jgi:hypothetical protein
MYLHAQSTEQVCVCERDREREREREREGKRERERWGVRDRVLGTR